MPTFTLITRIRRVGAWRLSGILGCVLGLVPAAPAQSSPVPDIQQTILEERLRQYSGSDPVREATLKKMFRDAGCDGDTLKEMPVLNSAAPNVSCTLPGSGDGVIVVGAHFDHVAAGDGVADNWSGASMLPTLFQSLNSAPRFHNFVFIGFTDEEKGFLGSRAYVDGLSKGELARIRAMVDIDTLGLGPTEIWVSNSDPKLVKLLIALAAKMNLPLKGMNVDGVGDSDGRPFKHRGIPVITLHSVTDETMGILHTGKDTLSAIRLDAYHESYRLIAAYLALLDSTLSDH